MLEDASIRPYFIDAVYRWCVEKGYTPHLLANWREDNSSAVPKRLVSGGKIVFNISPEAVRHLVIESDGVYFTARFLGQTVEVNVPLTDVVSVYALEKQSGISFPPLSPAEAPSPQQTAPSGKSRRRKMTMADIKII